MNSKKRKNGSLKKTSFGRAPMEMEKEVENIKAKVEEIKKIRKSFKSGRKKESNWKESQN